MNFLQNLVSIFHNVAIASVTEGVSQIHAIVLILESIVAFFKDN